MTPRTLMTIGGCLALAGCGLGSSPLVAGTPSSRCANAMRRAMPDEEIEITAMKGAGDQTQDLETIRATVEGTMKGAKPGPVAMECVFHDGVLVSIRWLAGPEAAK